VEWKETGIVLAVRRHGETSAIAEILTEGRGRCLGLVRGGRSRNMRPVLQPGNIVQATWRARLDEHLGNFSIEPVDAIAGTVIGDPVRLAGLMTLTAHSQLLPEREPHERLYAATRVLLDALSEDSYWIPLLVRWELGLLDELGFGLDLSRCAATGTHENLIYVSPRTGRAVSADAGVAYRDKLLRLPAFLKGSQAGTPDAGDILDGFHLTGFFLMRHVFEPRSVEMPEARERIVAHATRSLIPLQQVNRLTG
jgi:DNA repair protein RecO (recombination protein O)